MSPQYGHARRPPASLSSASNGFSQLSQVILIMEGSVARAAVA
jgi:hypothetical protein